MLMANTVHAAKMRRASSGGEQSNAESWPYRRIGQRQEYRCGNSARAGAEVIEADELGRALMEPGQPVYAEIVRVFGPEVVAPDGRLNRKRLAEMVFRDGRGGDRLGELNAIVHPR